MAEKEALEGSGQAIKELDTFPSSENIDPSSRSAAPSIHGTAAEPKKKRGRPRKYSSDGGSTRPLSPTPISVSVPLTGDYSVWKHSSSQKKQKLDMETAGVEMAASSSGGNLIPHVITVAPGEDVMQRIISFAQQGTEAICILAANGTVSNVTLFHADSCGGTLTYEGQFEILSLTGSFMPREIGLTKITSGGTSVCLAGSDGRVLGGGLSGMLVAASPVQVVIGSFLPVSLQNKPKKPKFHEHTIYFAANTVSNEPAPEKKSLTIHFGGIANSTISIDRANPENDLVKTASDSREPSNRDPSR